MSKTFPVIPMVFALFLADPLWSPTSAQAANIPKDEPLILLNKKTGKCLYTMPGQTYVKAGACDASHVSTKTYNTFRFRKKRVMEDGVARAKPYLFISDLNNHYCLDVYGAKTGAGANVGLYRCVEANNQTWVKINQGVKNSTYVQSIVYSSQKDFDFFSLRAVHSGKCLAYDGNRLFQYSCNGSDGQLFAVYRVVREVRAKQPEIGIGNFSPHYDRGDKEVAVVLQNKANRKCLVKQDVWDNQGHRVINTDCELTRTRQKFVTHKRSQNHYAFLNAENKLGIDLKSGTTSMIFWQNKNQPNQDFRRLNQGKTWFQLQERTTKKCLTLGMGGWMPGRFFIVSTCDPGAENQLFKNLLAQ